MRSPHRWIDGALPEAAKGMPGVHGNILSFLGGAHGCIGFRFSLYECVSPFALHSAWS